MTTRHVERLIDFNHEMMEPLQFHIDEDIHYKKEEIGIRASGYLYLSGKYKAKEGIRLFQELLEVDILAPFEKIEDESAFAVHVVDYDYSVRDGDLLIDITIEIDGLDESTVQPNIDDELDELEADMLEEDMEDIDNIEESIDFEDIEADLNHGLDSRENSFMDEQLPIKEPQNNIQPPHPTQMEENQLPPGRLPDTPAWDLADLIAYENDNTNFGLDFTDQNKVNEQLDNLSDKTIQDMEQKIRNYVTSKELTQMLESSMDDIGNDPVRIMFDLQELEDVIPAATTPSESSAAHLAWKAEVALLQQQYQNNAQPASAGYLRASTDMAAMIRKFNTNQAEPVCATPPVQTAEPTRVNPDMIHEMNQSITPKDGSYYPTSHAKQPLKHDVNQRNDATQKAEADQQAAYQFEPKIPNLDVPFTRDTVFPWEMESLYDKYEFTVQPNSPLTPQQPNCPIRYARERKGGFMNPYETSTVSADALQGNEDIAASCIKPVAESQEMQDLIDLIEGQGREAQEETIPPAKPTMPTTPTAPTAPNNVSSAGARAKQTKPKEQVGVNPPQAKTPKIVKPAEEAGMEEDMSVADVSNIEDLFEDADSKIVNMRIIIARDNDTYESIAQRYHVNDMKLAQHNHHKPIHERTLIIIPLD